MVPLDVWFGTYIPTEAAWKIQVKDTKKKKKKEEKITQVLKIETCKITRRR
jgi:hypothetical protein